MIETNVNQECLLQLGITVTQSTEADPDSNILLEFLTAEPTARAAFIANEGTAGILYVNSNRDCVAASMAWQPRSRELRKYVVIAQQGTSLAYGTDPILFPVEELNGHVLVPMYKADAKNLGLTCSDLKLTTENCPLPTPLVFADIFTKVEDVVLTAVPSVIAVGYGGLLPDGSWAKSMAALVSAEAKSSITGGQPQQGLANAYAMLRSNDYHSYTWCEEAKFGVKNELLSKEFLDKIKPEFASSMRLRTSGCGRGTIHRDPHLERYETFLRRGMARRQAADAVTYNTIVSKHTISEPERQP